MLKFKEFLLVFYGSYWSTEARQVAARINEFMKAVNPWGVFGDDGDASIEVFYISDDKNEEDFSRFLMEQNDQ